MGKKQDFPKAKYRTCCEPSFNLAFKYSFYPEAGRSTNFRPMGFGQFLKNDKLPTILDYLLFSQSMYRLCINFGKRNGWATSWAIFSQTHLVTLVVVDRLRILSWSKRLSFFTVFLGSTNNRVC
jgi:hypothetical protein